MLCVPVWKRNRVVYPSVPLGYRIWTKEVTKLELTTDMVYTVMPELEQKHRILFLFDSWYTKKSLVYLANEHENVGNTFFSQKIFLFQQKRPEIIILVFVKYL